ncbi:MAG: hypothetical protein EOO06_03365 [Chitinophagaceae bacterium]|nr:MAG: hypothetical protein EOO06_03365 [Chitinophagaceae bacterium]
MKLTTIINKIDKYLADGDERGLVDWFREKILRDPGSLDLSYWYQEALACYNFDAEFLQREPGLLQQCTEVIRNRSVLDPIDVAKAYAYRGEMRYYKVDRVKDFDKALQILNSIKDPANEQRFLKQFITELYDQHIRKQLHFYTTAQNMFIV